MLPKIWPLFARIKKYRKGFAIAFLVLVLVHIPLPVTEHARERAVVKAIAKSANGGFVLCNVIRTGWRVGPFQMCDDPKNAFFINKTDYPDTVFARHGIAKWADQDPKPERILPDGCVITMSHVNKFGKEADGFVTKDIFFDLYYSGIFACGYRLRTYNTLLFTYVYFIQEWDA